MRTASHVGRIRVSGYHWFYRAVRSTRSPLNCRKARPYSSTQPKTSSWRYVTTARNVQSPVVVQPEHDREHWILQCDLFLPLELRSKTWDDNLSTFAGVRSVEHLPQVLAESHSAFPSGVLTHIASVQKRWSAAFFLCQALLRFENKPASKPLVITNGSPWSTLKATGPLVDVDFLQKPPNFRDIILFTDKDASESEYTSLDHIAETPFIKQDEEAQLWKLAIGQIWRCIGEVMLASTRENSLLQVDMVSFVQQVLAAMHSSGVMSDDIYLFEPNSVASSVRKPPFLHLMSSRVMTALSDVMWKKVEPDLMRDIAIVAARHAHKGAESPAGKNGPSLRSLEPEVWLELILWGCVHGEHFHTGAKLLQAMFNEEHRWKTVPWSALQAQLEAKLSEQEDMNKNRSWYQRLASSIEGYSEEKPFVNLGENTISREVVVRLCDGILSSPGSHLATPIAAGTLVADCFEILNSHRAEAVDAVDYAFLCRAIDGNSMDNVLQLAEAAVREPCTKHINRGSSTSGERRNNIQADPQHGLLTKTLAYHIERLDVQKALQSYEQLKIWSGNAEHDTDSSAQSSMVAEIPLPSRMDLQFLVPSGLFAALLDLVTNSRLFQTGQSLIEPFTQNGEITSTTSQRSTALRKAILRFAGASSNPAILKQLHEKGYPELQSLDIEALRELLHLEIADRNWFMSRRILQNIAESQNTMALVEDAARIAVRVMRTPPRFKETNIEQLRLLTEVLSGQYHPQRSKGEAKTLQEPRQLNQLSQVLVSINDRRFNVLESYIEQDGQLGNPTILPTTVFNTLLEAVVDVYGTSAGQQLVTEWCQIEFETDNIPGDRDFRPVSPNLETMRILLQPFTSRYRRFYRHKQVFTETGARGKDAEFLELLFGGRNNIRTLYETILGFYYTSYGADLSAVFFAMDVCRARRLSQENTFYSLLQPMEENNATSDTPVDSAESITEHKAC